MMNLKKHFHMQEKLINTKINNFSATHPYAFFSMLVAGVPLGILVAVLLISTVVALPISLIAGCF